MSQQLQVNTSYKQILKIALLISLALLVQQLNFVTNAVFLGHLSEEALANLHTAEFFTWALLFSVWAGTGICRGRHTGP